MVGPPELPDAGLVLQHNISSLEVWADDRCLFQDPDNAQSAVLHAADVIRQCPLIYPDLGRLDRELADCLATKERNLRDLASGRTLLADSILNACRTVVETVFKVRSYRSGEG
jgi:hypothetical protein